MSDDWNAPSSGSVTGLGSLRMALLFGAGAVALALLVAPIVDRQTRLELANSPQELDRMSTGSVTKGDRYTIRRSVLQETPGAVCIIRLAIRPAKSS